MQIFSVFSPKGGVGKTTACLYLSVHAVRSGIRVLLVDLDPLGAATHCLKVRTQGKGARKTLLKGGQPLKKGIRPTDYPLLDVLPAGFGYRKLQEKHPGNGFLRNSLDTYAERYDLVCVDGPPDLSPFSETILSDCTLVLVPVIPAPLGRLSVRLIEKHRKDLGLTNANVKLFVSMLDRRKKLQRETAAWLLGRDDCLKTVIPYSACIERFTAANDTLTQKAFRSTAAQAYGALWEEASRYMYRT